MWHLRKTLGKGKRLFQSSILTLFAKTLVKRTLQGEPLTRILVIRSHAMGDMVTCLPLLNSLSLAYPKAKITCATSRIGKEVISEYVPFIDTILFEHYWSVNYHLSKMIRLIYRIHNQKYHLIINTTNISDNVWYSLLVLLSFSPLRVGFVNSINKDIFNLKCVEDPLVHDVERNINILDVLGMNAYITKHLTPIIFTDKERKDLELKVRGTKLNEIIVLHPFGKRPSRSWSSELYEELINKLLTLNDYIIVFIGGEKDRILIEKYFNQSNDSVVNLAGSLTFHELVILLQEALLFIGVDSGPFHLRCLSNKPTVAIWGPGDFKKWGDYDKPNIRILRNEVPCAPCYEYDCRDKACFNNITPELVFQQALDILK